MIYVLCLRRGKTVLAFGCESLAVATEQLWECLGSGEYEDAKISREPPKNCVAVHVVRPAAYAIYDERAS